MTLGLNDFQKKLWETADKLRANSSLKYNEFSTPVLGLIFLRFAVYRFNKAKPEIEAQKTSSRRAFDEKMNTRPEVFYMFQKKHLLHIY